MSRPEGAVRWYRGVQFSVGVIAVAGFAALSLAAAAESASSELQPRLVAETQETGSIGEPVAAPDDGSVADDQRAHELFLDGMEKLAAGRTEWAQRTFESVVARFPGSQAATRARRELGGIYRNGAAPQTAGPDTGNAVPAPQEQPLPIGSTPAWEQELRRNASIQTMLRNEAGDRVFFSVGSAELGARARTALAAQAQWLNRWHEFEVAIEGHADEPGTDAENLQLSATRADAVRQRLLAEGVDARRLVVVAQGRSQRVAVCAGPDCNAQNRRAVTLVFTTGTAARLGLGDAPATAQLQGSRPGTLAATPPAPGLGAEERVGAAH